MAVLATINLDGLRSRPRRQPATEEAQILRGWFLHSDQPDWIREPRLRPRSDRRRLCRCSPLPFRQNRRNTWPSRPAAENDVRPAAAPTSRRGSASPSSILPLLSLSMSTAASPGTTLNRLEHGVYNLSRMRESATKRYKVYQIPMNWMMDNGIVNQIKLASVKLGMKYMKRVSAELGSVGGGGGPEEDELVVQAVKFAFRVHQFGLLS